MLNESLGWCGKLPIYSDFIQSNHFRDVEQALMKWMMKGQDHIGEQFFQSYDTRFTLYYYFLESSITDHKRIQGIFFSSHDSRGRHFPFMIFTHQHQLQPTQALQYFDEQLKKMNLDWHLISEQLNADFLTQMQQHLAQIEVNEMFEGDKDLWLELYPQTFHHNFKIDSTNHVVYRKLLIR
ncbi:MULTISPECIES: type VI secretion system-associated protein TagF [Acinetobacter]|uniref:Type VI secretion system-associated protein TagF n=1 Tax=Acinetobacter piscicola TaxID=2006115 RepID=A0A7S6VY46_9GAMM|nr:MULTISPECIES: type VI secretion system-associated protein TagF [Acinetobacter]QOW47022.1 type VI secretion system-associated protein TagF [Acinetobacter piscicola]